MAIALRLVASRLGVRNARARMPFRFGIVTMRAASIVTLEAEIEDARGQRALGYAGDFLAYRWFDKRPERSLAENVADLLTAVDLACAMYRERASRGTATPFDIWFDTYGEIERRALAAGLNRLTAQFGASLLERAVIDAAGRLTGRPLFALVHGDALGIDPGRIHPELADRSMSAFLPAAPLARVAIRHTVGLVDPVTAADLAMADPVDDGLPVTLEDYLRIDRLRFLKVKVSGRLDADIARLETISAVILGAGRRIAISLDGNEQYKELDGFRALVAALQSRPSLREFWDSVLFIEQPLDRSVAMDAALAPALRALGEARPVIIDESDAWTTAFREAMDLGYRGVSHKNCKGIYKSLLNLALAQSRNEALGQDRFFLSAEDLTNLPVVPLQADLAAVAVLGIPHVERNGHHYFRGLDHLPAPEQQAAHARHGDLYEQRDGRIGLRIVEGEIAIGSLQTPGMGFAVTPDMGTMTPPDRWSLDSLGIDEGEAVAHA